MHPGKVIGRLWVVNRSILAALPPITARAASESSPNTSFTACELEATLAHSTALLLRGGKKG